MKKNDLYMAGAVLLAAAIWWGIQYFGAQEGAEITVTKDGERIGTYSLLEDNCLTFSDEDGGMNILMIQDGKAYMSGADCPDKLCVKQKAISKKGESIVCLPHKLVVQVTDGSAAEVDAIAG